MFSVNQRAVKVVKDIIADEEALGVKVFRLNNGATVIDMGIETGGSWKAAKLFVEATIGRLGLVSYGRFKVKNIELPSIEVHIDKPREGTLSAQFSGWKMPGEGFDVNPIGSGPARAIPKNDIFSQCVDYQDIHHEAVFAAQTTELPGEDLAENISEECGIEPENLYILAATSGSLVGTVQVCSRTVEASMWRLEKKGFDIDTVISGRGVCPVPPQTKDELLGMDRTNTALIYGGSVHYIVDWEDEKIKELMEELPFTASPNYGRPFIDIFEEGDRDFYKVDKDIHTIAKYTITNINSGKTFQAGEINKEELYRVFFEVSSYLD